MSRAKETTKRLDHVERALHGAVDRNTTVLGNGNHTVRLDVDVLLMSSRVRAFNDHDIIASKSGFDVSLHDVDCLEHDIGLLGIEHRIFSLVLDDDLRCVDRFLAFVRQQDNRLGHVLHFMLGQKWLVLRHEIDCIFRGNIPIIDDREAGGIELVPDRFDLAARYRRPNCPAVEHVWEDDVVRITGTTCRLSNSVLSGDAVSYG